MRRLVNCYCSKCDITHEIICDEDAIVKCAQCHGPLEQRWWEKARVQDRTQWDEKDAVVVFRKPDGTFSFPARNDKPTPEGCERIVARSDKEVAAIERMTGTLNAARWHDNTDANSFDTGPLPPLPSLRR